MAARKGLGRDRVREEVDESEQNYQKFLDERELQDLYAWVDQFPLSRKKQNISRDFSDGVLVAEILKTHFPKMVELHNYTPASGTKNKLLNWETLNSKVFPKMNFELAEEVIQDLVQAKPGIIEKVLSMLKLKIERAQYAVMHNNEKPEADQHQVSPGRGNRTMRIDSKGGPKGSLKKPVEHAPIITKQKMQRSFAESETVSRILYEEKAQELLAKDEMLQILNSKIARLEHLLSLKSQRIEDLTARLNAMSRPTGGRR